MADQNVTYSISKVLIKIKKGEAKMLINTELFKYFEKDKEDNFVNVDIDIFEKLDSWFKNGEIKNSKHKAFTFAYYWLISYFWKYGKYGQHLLTIKDIKKILGYSPIDKRLDYIVKENGLLDSKGYTELSRDFPVYSFFSEQGLELIMTTDLDPSYKRGATNKYSGNYSVKKPLKMINRTYKEGLMTSNDDSFKLYIYEFTRIVLTDGLGVDGFYVYAWLKWKSKMICKSKFPVYYSELIEATNFSDKKLRKILQLLEKVNLIKIHNKTLFNKENQNFSTKNSYELLYKPRIWRIEYSEVI